MSAARSFWEEVYKRFDPSLPPEKHEWRVTRPYSPRDIIGAGLRRPFGTNNHYVMIGTSGTGLSTELLAIAEEHTRDRMVVFFDVYDHFVNTVGDEAAINYVEPWEILMLIGLAVYRAAKESLGHDWADTHLKQFTEAVAEFVTDPDKRGKKPTVDVARLAGAMAVLAGGAVGGAAGTGLTLIAAAGQAARWDFELGRPYRRRRRGGGHVDYRGALAPERPGYRVTAAPWDKARSRIVAVKR